MTKPAPAPDAQPEENSGENVPQANQAGTAQNLGPEQMARFVTTIKGIEEQVGEHVIRALQHADTVAVITTVVIGPGGQQHIVSAALDARKTAQVNSLLQSAAEEREEEIPCVGFHCLIDPKRKES